MSARALVFITEGTDFRAWTLAAPEESATGEPVQCAACPLRRGGEWDAGLTGCLPHLSPGVRADLTRWSCHRVHRPCGGMRRHLATARDDGQAGPP